MHHLSNPRLAERQPREHRGETWHQQCLVGSQRGRTTVEEAQCSEEEALRSGSSATFDTDLKQRVFLIWI